MRPAAPTAPAPSSPCSGLQRLTPRLAASPSLGDSTDAAAFLKVASERGLRSGYLAQDSAPMINSPGPRGTVERRVTVPAKAGLLLTGSRLLSPRGHEERAQVLSRAGETRATRPLGALCANAVPEHAAREARGNVARKRSGPEDRSAGPLLITGSRKFGTRENWLRMGFRPRTLSVNAFGTDSYIRTDPRRRSHRECESLARERWDRFADSHCTVMGPSPRDRVPLGHVEQTRSVPAPAGL
jgi:hypothetical protein